MRRLSSGFMALAAALPAVPATAQQVLVLLPVERTREQDSARLPVAIEPAKPDDSIMRRQGKRVFGPVLLDTNDTDIGFYVGKNDVRSVYRVPLDNSRNPSSVGVSVVIDITPDPNND